MKNVPWLHWCGSKSFNWSFPPFMRSIWPLDALHSPSWGFYPESLLQSRSSIVAQAGPNCIVCRAVHSPISSYPELLNELPGGLHNSSVTPSPASCCFWLIFLDGSCIQLVISHCLTVSGLLMGTSSQQPTLLRHCGTVPWWVKPLPLPFCWSPWAPGSSSVMELPHSCCSLMKKIIAEIFQIHLSPFVTCVIWLYRTHSTKKPKKVVSFCFVY